MFAAMAFDAPGSEHQLGAWVVFFVVLSIPLWFVLGAITGWFLYLRNWLRASALIAATPIAATTMGWLPATGITDAMGMLCPTQRLSRMAGMRSFRLNDRDSSTWACPTAAA
jgi:hypothetical protein